MGVICIWDTPDTEYALTLPLTHRLCVNPTPSQVIYSSQTSPTLAATWLSSMNTVATGRADGSIQLYRVEPSCPSAVFVDGAVREMDEESRYSNGLFDTMPGEA